MLRTSLMLATLMLATNVANAQGAAVPSSEAANAPSAAESETQKMARARLMEMARFLGNTIKNKIK